MAQIETWLNQDMMQAVKVRYLDGNLFSQDNAGNLIGVKLTRDGEDYSGGGTVSANVIRADGGTVAVTGALSGNVATVVLPQSAYAVPGVVSIVVKLTVSGAIITIAAVVANIYQSSTETAIDPGTIIPSIQTLINQINTAVASIPADYSSLWATLAPAFSTSTAYTIGQYVTYDGGLYRFTSAHPAGAWSASDATAAVVGGVLTDLQTGKADKTDPVFYGTISKGRKGNSQAGTGSVALGDNVTANGWFSQAEGQGTIANGSYQRASGKYNVADTGNTYAEMVGNGYAEVDQQTFVVTEHRSNARTLDWNGNETLAGDLTVNKGTANEVTLGSEVSNLKNEISLIINGINNDGLIEPTLIWQTGKYISKTDNTITSGNSQLCISNYIPIPSGTNKIEIYKVVNFSNGWTVAFYDENKGFISGEYKTTTYAQSQVFSLSTIPSNAKYFVIGHYDYNDQYPSSNVSAIIYFLDGIIEITNDIDDLKEDSIKIGFDESYENILAGASTFTDNKCINDQGNIVTNQNFCLIDGYFPIKPSTVYKLYRGEPSLYSNAGHNWTFWDENKSFISYTLSGSAVTSPINARFLRLGIYISNTGSATHENFDPTNVIVTENTKPCFDNIFTSLVSRPVFSGMKWIGIGDSITEENFRATYHYHDYIKAETGLSFVNMGVSGTGYKAEGSGDKAFYKRVPNMATDADLITIFGGVNDVVLSNATIGTASDTGTDTICGCVNETIDEIEELYPAHMPIGIISPLPCYCSDTSVNLHPYQKPDDETNRMSQFVEQLSLICKHRGIPFLDLFHQSNLRPWHSECNAKYFSCDSAPTGDGLHPNGHGHRLFYRQILEFIKGIIAG